VITYLGEWDLSMMKEGPVKELKKKKLDELKSLLDTSP
jgi:hypothetical protein